MISGDELREARTAARMTQEEFASRVGVTQRSVGNWERGDGVPRAQEARTRAILGHFLTGHPDPTNPLSAVSDLALLAELGRRLDRAREKTDHDPAAKKTLRAVPPPTTDETYIAPAARSGRKAGPSSELQRQAEAGEENQDEGEPS